MFTLTEPPPPPALILFKDSNPIASTPARDITYSPLSASIIVPPWLCKFPPTAPPLANLGGEVALIPANCCAPIAPIIAATGILNGVGISARAAATAA